MVRLKYERLKRGWSLQTLGYEAKMQGAEISKIERGILLPYASQRMRLAQALALTEDALMEDVEAYDPPWPRARQA